MSPTRSDSCTGEISYQMADALFYVYACAYPVGVAGVLMFYNRRDWIPSGWVFSIIVSAMAVMGAVVATLGDPWIMLKIFTRTQVAEQMHNPVLLYTSVAHWAIGDVAVLLWVTTISRTRLHMSAWELALFVPLLVWFMPFGLLTWLCYPKTIKWIWAGTK